MNKNAEDFDEARWRRLADADAAEEPLSEADREFLEGFVPRSTAARAEAQLFSAMARLGEDDWQDEEAANSPLVDATVQHVLAARHRAAPATQGTTPTMARRRWTVTGLAVAAAAVIIAWLGLRPSEAPSEPTPDASRIARADDVPEPAASSSAAPEPEPGVVVPDPAPAPAALRVASGRLRDAEGRALVAEAAVRGVVQVDSERACLGIEQATACFQRGARLELTEDRQGLTVLEGVGTIDVPVPIVAGVLVVQIAGERYTMASPVTIETSVYDLKRARVEVTNGEVELRDAEGKTHVLAAGAVRGRTKTAQIQPPDAKTLLAKARASRSASDRVAAIAHYESLLRHHPDHAASHAAMVSLGDLYLDTHQPAAALGWFQRYLDEGGGSLAQEASIGRIKALRALRRETELQQAIDAFRERYPSSRYVDPLGK